LISIQLIDFIFPAAIMRSMLAFIVDQILQFWPPYRMEHLDQNEIAD